jgi:hypothetical protein
MSASGSHDNNYIQPVPQSANSFAPESQEQGSDATTTDQSSESQNDFKPGRLDSKATLLQTGFDYALLIVALCFIILGIWSALLNGSLVESNPYGKRLIAASQIVWSLQDTLIVGSNAIPVSVFSYNWTLY